MEYNIGDEIQDRKGNNGIIEKITEIEGNFIFKAKFEYGVVLILKLKQNIKLFE